MNHKNICRWLWLSVFLLLVCPQPSSAQALYLCEYDVANNLLLSAPAAGGLQGLSPIVHDAPSGKVLRAGDKAFIYDAWGRVKTVSLVSGSGGGGGGECPPPGPPGGGGNNTLLVSYEYDALGRRFSATSANDVRYFDYDGATLLHEQSIYTGSSQPNPEALSNPEELPNPEAVFAACLNGEITLEEAVAMMGNVAMMGSAQGGASMNRLMLQGVTGLIGIVGSAGANPDIELDDPSGNVVGVVSAQGGSGVQVWQGSSGWDNLGNAMNPAALGGGANAPPSLYPFTGKDVRRDEATGLDSDASDGLSGVYDRSVGGDVEDDFEGENPYGGLLSAINTGASAAKEALELAADLHPASGFTGFVTGKDSRGCNLSAAARALDGFSMVPGGGLLGGAAKGGKALARGAKASFGRGRQIGVLIGKTGPEIAPLINGVTKDSSRMAGMMNDGRIKMKMMDDKSFNEFAVDIDGINPREVKNLRGYSKGGMNNIRASEGLGAAVHEGKHSMDEIDGHWSQSQRGRVRLFVSEWRSHSAEDKFNKAIGANSNNAMKRFKDILKNYF